MRRQDSRTVVLTSAAEAQASQEFDELLDGGASIVQAAVNIHIRYHRRLTQEFYQYLLGFEYHCGCHMFTVEGMCSHALLMAEPGTTVRVGDYCVTFTERNVRDREVCSQCGGPLGQDHTCDTCLGTDSQWVAPDLTKN